jgi:SAM-dependent methyltransferase
MEKRIGPSGSHKSTNEAVFQLIVDSFDISSKILDFGAGNGHMCQKIGHHMASLGINPENCLSACDISPEAFEYNAIKCAKVEANSFLPFEDGSFNLIYAIEVLEHMRRPYDFFMEAFRVLQPGGKLIFTAPNTLQLVSRLSFLITGFYDMYLPPSSKLKNAGRICGHIMPLNFAYYAYGLRSAGFAGGGDISLHFDRYKKSARGLLFLSYPIFKLASALYKRKIKKYDKEVYEENQLVINEMNSFGLLCSRSCIVKAVKGIQ